MSEAASVLIIGDESELCSSVRAVVTRLGLGAEVVHDRPTALERARTASYVLVVIALDLPGCSVFDFCRDVRAIDKHIPLLVVCSRSDELDCVLALELGADEYVAQPFSVRALEARVRALLRRSALGLQVRIDRSHERLSFGSLEIDPLRTAVTIDGKPCRLTALEYEILLFMARHPGRTFTRRQLLEKVRGDGCDGDEPTLTKHLSRLRCKIELNPSAPRFIKTVRGLGYRFVPPGEH